MNTVDTECKKTSLQKAIAAHPFFKGLGQQYLKTLTEASMFKEFAAGEMIFREGDMANRFYLILDGKVVLEASEQDEESVAIEQVGAGEALGWSWLFPPYYWHLNARAVEPTRAIFFYGTRLREEGERNHAFGYELMKRMAEVVIHRLQATRKRLIEQRIKARR